MERQLIPAADFLAVIPEIAAEGGISALAHRVAAAGIGYAGVERRLRALIAGEQQAISVALADRILSALDRPHALFALEPDYVPASEVVCEDCGEEIEDDVMPIDLFREEPTALEGRVWNKTVGKWVYRPKRARAGGRRFRAWHLCRRCRAEVLRERAHKADGRGLRARDRIAPKRGGRPRLLSDDELRSAHRAYVEVGLSRREIARRLAESREKGTQAGYEQSLLYGWRRLGLKLRDKGAQVAISRHGASVDWQPHRKQRCKRCKGWVWKEATQERLCWNHAMQERRNHDRSNDGTLAIPA